MKRNNQCHTHLLNVTLVVKNSFVFVQLDKPIYKPGDAIKFRIILLNSTMQADESKNLNVMLLNPENAIVQSRENVNTSGLFKDNFMLPTNAMEGNWTIFIKADNANAIKPFPVKKYTLPLYELKVRIKPKIYLMEKDLIVDVEAVYSFGGFIAGNATILVKTSKGIVIITRNAPIKSIYTFSFSLRNDLKIETTPEEFMTLSIEVRFQDHFDLLTTIQTRQVDVYFYKKCKLEVIAPQHYTEGVPYNFDVIILDSYGNAIDENSPEVKAKIFNDHSRCSNQIIERTFVRNSVASFTIKSPRKCEGKNILKVSYLNDLCETFYDVLEVKDELKEIFLLTASTL